MKLMITVFMVSAALDQSADCIGCTSRSAGVHFAHIPEVLLPDYKC